MTRRAPFEDDRTLPDDYEAAPLFKAGEPFRQHHFTIEGYLGSGGSGQVFAVRHHFTHDLFALKVGHVSGRPDIKDLQRRLIVARAHYCIEHRNVVRVLDLACENDGLVWQRMELLDGKTVRELLQRHGRFSPLYALDIALETAHALQAVHEHQIIHRDVKPTNLFIRTSGTVTLTDLSLAKVLPAGLQTTQGRLLGSTAYMAPEYLRGAELTPVFDVYALGFTLWEMLVGEHPFRAALNDIAALIDCQLKEMPPSLVAAAGMPPYVDEVLRRAIAKDPLQRYPSMWDFAQALRDLRARLATDPALDRKAVPSWQAQYPVLLNPFGRISHRGPTSLPGENAPPSLPSQRIIVQAPPVPPSTAAPVSAPAPSVPSVRPPASLAGTLRLGAEMPLPNAARPLSRPATEPTEHPLAQVPLPPEEARLALLPPESVAPAPPPPPASGRQAPVSNVSSAAPVGASPPDTAERPTTEPTSASFADPPRRRTPAWRRGWALLAAASLAGVGVVIGLVVALSSPATGVASGAGTPRSEASSPKPPPTASAAPDAGAQGPDLGPRPHR